MLEVFNALGDSIAIVSVPENNVQPLRADEILAVRPLANDRLGNTPLLAVGFAEGGHNFSVLIDPQSKLPAAIRTRTGGEGADVVLDCTGRAATVKLAAQCLRIGGRLVVVGSPHEEVTLEDLFDWIADKAARRSR